MKTYTIKKGKHSSGLHLRSFIFKDKFEFGFSINFDHFTPRNFDDIDTNKLFGFSFGYHHNNSIRLGWLPCFENKDEVRIFIYYYNKANPNYKGTFSKDGAVISYLRNVKKGEENLVTFHLNEAKETFTTEINDRHYKHSTFIIPKFKLGYLLYPYYGGNNTAPVDIKVKIDRY